MIRMVGLIVVWLIMVLTIDQFSDSPAGSTLGDVAPDVKATPSASIVSEVTDVQNATFFPAASVLPSPSNSGLSLSPQSSPSPSPSPSSLPLPSTLSSPNLPLPSIVPEDGNISRSLLTEPITINNHTHAWSIPTDIRVQNSAALILTVEYQLSSWETAVGFDNPGFVISADDVPIYQLAVAEVECQGVPCVTPWRRAQLRLNLHHLPKTISIWSGNSGDEQQQTVTMIRSLVVRVEQVQGPAEVAAVTQLHAVRDVAGTVTVSWLSPTITTNHLDRALSYNIYVDGQLADVLLPVVSGVAVLPGREEYRLITAPDATQRIGVQAVDWLGRASALVTTTISGRTDQ